MIKNFLICRKSFVWCLDLIGAKKVRIGFGIYVMMTDLTAVVSVF